MKYLIKEEKINNLIENYIKSNIDDVVWVKFKKGEVFLAHDDITIESTTIIVLVDTIGILEGNLYSNKMDYTIRTEIWNTLNTVFGLDMDKYGSKWDLEVLQLKATVI